MSRSRVKARDFGVASLRNERMLQYVNSSAN